MRLRLKRELQSQQSLNNMNNATPLPDLPQTPETKKPPINKALGVILGVLVVALIGIAAVFVSGMYQKPVEPTPSSQTIIPTVSPTPADEEEEAEAVDTGDVEQDLEDVEKDVNAL